MRGKAGVPVCRTKGPRQYTVARWHGAPFPRRGERPGAAARSVGGAPRVEAQELLYLHGHRVRRIEGGPELPHRVGVLEERVRPVDDEVGCGPAKSRRSPPCAPGRSGTRRRGCAEGPPDRSGRSGVGRIQGGRACSRGGQGRTGWYRGHAPTSCCRLPKYPVPAHPAYQFAVRPRRGATSAPPPHSRWTPGAPGRAGALARVVLGQPARAHPHHRNAQLDGEGPLAEGAVAAADGCDGFAGAYREDVAALLDPGSDGDGDEGVRDGAARPLEDAYGDAVGLSGLPSGGFIGRRRCTWPTSRPLYRARAGGDGLPAAPYLLCVEAVGTFRAPGFEGSVILVAARRPRCPAIRPAPWYAATSERPVRRTEIAPRRHER